MARTLIKGGTVVTATETTEADVLVDGEKIVAIYARGSEGIMASLAEGAVELAADKVIDATGTPSIIDCAAMWTVLRPEPHTLLIVMAGVVWGRPAFTAA